MRYTRKSDANLRGCKPDDSWGKVAAETLTVWENWNVMSALLLGTAKGHKRRETKEVTEAELELKTLLLKKKREGRHLERAEMNRLCRTHWRKRRALKREKHLTKIKESAETVNASKKRALEKLESGLCGWNADLSEETCESLEQIQKLGKVHWIRSQRMF